MIKSLMMIGAAGCLALEAFANTAATYTAGVTSLANGKITFEYDGSDNITKMRMKPDYGETLTLTGDTLSFADGAQIITSQQGKPVIANTISADGSLRLGGVTNMSWSGTTLKLNDESTMFHGVRVDDISPVSSDSTGISRMGSKVYLPYNIRRESGVLRAEFQAIDSTYVKGFYLELRQKDDDIVGKVLAVGYYDSQTNYLGLSMFEDPLMTVSTSLANDYYGLKQLVIGARRDTYDHCGKLFSENGTVVASNVKVEELEILRGGNLAHASRGWNTFTPIPPRHVRYGDGFITAQFSQKDNANVKCIMVELRQSGNNVIARNFSARWAATEDLDYDFETEPYNTTNVATEENYESGKTIYGLDMISLRRKSKDKLTFSVDGTWNLDMPFTGDNTEVTFEAASATATVNATAANTMTNSAYIITGDVEHVMKFYANPSESEYKVVLPAATDAYGTGTELHIWGYNKVNASGAAGSSAITMHPETKLITENKQVPFHPSESKVVLDGATLELATGTQNNNHLGYLTLLNGSTVCVSKHLCAGYNCTSPVYRIAGTGASTNKCKVVLFTSGNDLTLDVDDAVAGGAPDFIMDGDVENNGTTTAVFVKTGEGTMLMNGQIKNTANANRIVEGELLLGKTGATVSGASFSLEGGTLGLAAGTANEVADVTLTASSTISVGSGATLTIASLTVPEGSTLAINGDVLGHVKVSTALDAATLSRIRINGKAAYQSGNGYFIKRGLMIIFH